ncbi:MAG: 1,4-alpha-glucan branching protein GlgB [Gammaproteobacteria bacterium]|nr:1,4-alpha-glucan branching protein GlgB [Gammaproteobacteria bacterium]
MTNLSHIERLKNGSHHDPFEYLGRHYNSAGEEIIRVFMPSAEQVELEGFGPMKRVEKTDLFIAEPGKFSNIPVHYSLRWQEKHDSSWHSAVSPYSFGTQIGDLDLQLFAAGRHFHAYRFLGAHLKTIDGIEGCCFSVWAPNCKRVSVIGDFNGWHGLRNPMRSRGQSGVWELFVPGLHKNDNYKFEILSENGSILKKTDPYAQAMALRPDTTSLIQENSRFPWQDDEWLNARADFDWQHKPISIYEIHAGSWRRTADGEFLDWRELAEQLIPYVKHLNYTHIELLPIAEHPLDESWGYQISGYFAPTSRFGSADDFRYFVDLCHKNDIGVILDWVPAHFPKDDFALARFNGYPLYEHGDPRKGEHQDWGTLIFDYDRNEVRNFLLTNAVYWLEEFHVDGLRVDAVASMLYLDYSRKDGEWLPNRYGGRENLEAIAFLREMNKTVHGLFPGVLTFAEESTAWPMVSRPIELGGLGFSIKWNMGWMNDTLAYIEEDPVHRKYHHNKLTFSQIYAWTENFVLPFSHDEVVHLKRSMLDKMPGDLWQKFANLRVLYAWQTAHPGKKLSFMGNEFGQWREWNVKTALDWQLMEKASHNGLHLLVKDLNTLYLDNPGLHYNDFQSDGFRWIDCNDSDQSVLSLIRQSDDPDESIICILNFTPVVRESYRIGVPSTQDYQEVLNTDASCYGGSNVGNDGLIATQDKPWSGFSQSISIRVPPLAGLFLKAVV